MSVHLCTNSFLDAYDFINYMTCCNSLGLFVETISIPVRVESFESVHNSIVLAKEDDMQGRKRRMLIYTFITWIRELRVFALKVEKCMKVKEMRKKNQGECFNKID